MLASFRSEISAAEAVNATTSQRVAADIRRRILHGELASGQRLKLDELAAVCGTSHMPVRAALQELESEGVLELWPRKGAVIKAIDERFVANLYDVRGAIEGMLTERCAQAIDKAGAAVLKALVEEHRSAAQRGDTEGLLIANRRLHETINRRADNFEATRVLARGRVLVDALRMRYGFGAGRTDAIVGEHQALVRAIARGDVGPAGKLAREHCARARDDLLARLRPA